MNPSTTGTDSGTDATPSADTAAGAAAATGTPGPAEAGMPQGQGAADPSAAASAAPRQLVQEVVVLGGLTHVYRRPPLGEYLGLLWQRRHFIWADSRGRVISGSQGTILGLAWLVLRPVLDGLAFYLVFGLLLGTNRGIENFLGYLLIGVFLFRFTARCLSAGSLALVQGRNVLKAFAFPRAALPIAVVVREALRFVPALVVMLVLILAFPPLEPITWRWLLFPVILVLQGLFNLGMALWVARLTARLPDLNQLIGVLTRFWLYGSAVFFSYDRFIDHPRLLAVLELNPMFVVLDMSRDVLLYATTPATTSWVLLVAWTAAVGVGGLVFFWRAEERYGSL